MTAIVGGTKSSCICASTPCRLSCLSQLDMALASHHKAPILHTQLCGLGCGHCKQTRLTGLTGQPMTWVNSVRVILSLRSDSQGVQIRYNILQRCFVRRCHTRFRRARRLLANAAEHPQQICRLRRVLQCAFNLPDLRRMQHTASQPASQPARVQPVSDQAWTASCNSSTATAQCGAFVRVRSTV